MDGLVGAHRQRLADRLGGLVRTGRQNGDLTAVGLLDLESGFDGLSLISSITGSISRSRVKSPSLSFALRTGVGHLLDEYDNVCHGSSSTSCIG